MMGFTKGAVQEGTWEAPAPAPTGPPRPSTIPAHYVFDEQTELWMPPSVLQKAAAEAEAAAAAGALVGGDSGIQVIKSTDPNATPYAHVSSSDEPICFEFVNMGACSRLARGEVCRYRHLDASHPDVIADKVRNGKLPPIALDALKAGNAAALAALSKPAAEESICFEWVNGGSCPRLSAGQVCRYRHPPPHHPDVIADKLKNGKLSAISADAIIAGNAAMIAALNKPSASASATAAGVPPDPGPSARLCFDYINNGSCPRLSAGQTCKYRHLPPTHPDVIADRLRTGKITPAVAAQMLTSAADGSAISATPSVLPGGLNLAALLPPQAATGCAAVSSILDSAAISASASALADPGPGVAICFDFINKGSCSRLMRGEPCKYRHLAPNHPDAVADKIRQGKPPGALPTPPMGNYLDGLALMGSMAQGTLKRQFLITDPPTSRRKGNDDDDDDDQGERFRSRDTSRKRRVDRDERREFRRGYDYHRYDDHRYDDRRDYDRRDYDRREYDRRDYDRRDYDRRDYDRRDYDRRYDDRRYDDRREYDRRYDDRREYDRRGYDRRDHEHSALDIKPRDGNRGDSPQAQRDSPTKSPRA